MDVMIHNSALSSQADEEPFTSRRNLFRSLRDGRVLAPSADRKGPSSLGDWRSRPLKSRRGHAVKALRIIRRLMVDELELAGAGWPFNGGSEVRPGVERRGEVGAGQHAVARPARVAEAEFE